MTFSAVLVLVPLVGRVFRSAETWSPPGTWATTYTSLLYWDIEGRYLEQNLRERDQFLRDLDLDEESLVKRSPDPSPFSAEGAPSLDCARDVRPILCAGYHRSPQVIHTAVLPRLRGKEVVEIGSAAGDATECFAQIAKSVVAIEMNADLCPVLAHRQGLLRAQGLGSFEVICSSYDKATFDADVFITWAEVGSLHDDNVLQYLKRLQDSGLIRKSAEIVLLFDPALPTDRLSWQKYHKLFAWREARRYAEEEECPNPFPPGPTPLLRARLSGVFLAAGLPLSAAPGPGP